jgi:hypothetical protein
LILCGSYLYKFKDRSSTIPKGSPFEIERLHAETINNNNHHHHHHNESGIPEMGTLPIGYGSIFVISTLRRIHYYAVVDDEEATLWVRSIREARQECVTRNMGHSTNFPYPKSWTYFDGLGKSLVENKIRIRDRMESSRMREMEMADLGNGGPMPRMYHG